MKTTLFICQANVGRSQIAEGYFNSFSIKGRAISGGIVDKVAKYKGHPAPVIVQVMKEDGIDISKQNVKLVTNEMVKKADRIVVLCKQAEFPDELSGRKKIAYYDIEDPYEKGKSTARSVRDQIKKLVQTLLERENE